MSHPTRVPLFAIGFGQLNRAQAAAVAFLARYTNENTLHRYKVALHEWFDWCESQGVDGFADIQRFHVEMYIRHLTMERGLKPASVANSLAPVRGMFGLAAADGDIDRDPTRYARLPKIQVVAEAPFDRDDMRRFMRAAKELSPRHAALTALLMMMGMRVSEACSIDVPGIYNVEQGYRVLRFIGKGDKPANMPIPYQAIDLLEAAAGDRHMGPLLLMRGGERLSRSAASQLVNTIARRAGFERHVHPHLLRKAAVTLILDSGGDLREAQDFARHADPRTTRRHYDLSRNAYPTHATHMVAARIAV